MKIRIAVISLVLSVCFHSSWADPANPVKSGSTRPGAVRQALPASPGNRALKHYDPSLMITPATVMQKLKQNRRLFLVDIRHKREFNTFKIPGSVNIPLAFIKTKSFLKIHPVVIIHKSMNYSPIQNQAQSLNRNGYTIRILQGGLAAWKHKGGSLEGDPFASKGLNRISAAMLFMEKDHREWVIVNACEKKLKSHKAYFPRALHIPYPVKAGSNPVTPIRERVYSIFSDKTNPALTAVIIFDETGQKYDAFENMIGKALGHKVFYLKGGFNAYQKRIQSQMLANRPKDQRTRQTGHCKPCQTQNTPAKRKP